MRASEMPRRESRRRRLKRQEQVAAEVRVAKVLVRAPQHGVLHHDRVNHAECNYQSKEKNLNCMDETRTHAKVDAAGSMKVFRVVLHSFGPTYIEADSCTQDGSFIRFFRAGQLLAEYPPSTVKSVEETDLPVQGDGLNAPPSTDEDEKEGGERG